jgi:hypothetical protein
MTDGPYESWKAQIRSELEAFEGEGPPDADELWSVAQYNARAASDWINDMPISENEIEAAKGDVLEALVALEMAEERLEQEGSE